MSLRRLLLICSLVACLPPAEASADWLFTPFLGYKFAGATTLVDLDLVAGDRKVTLGGSVALLGGAIVGMEADFAYVPRYFQGEPGGLVSGSNVMTLFGNVIITAPLALTRESLRPYLIGGLGLMHAASDDQLEVAIVDSNLLGLGVGGGAVGFITERTGLRFDLRHFRSLTTDDAATLPGLRTRLTFWRATVGVTFRY